MLIHTAQFSLVGFIRDIGTHALSIAIKQPLAEGSVVSVEFGAERREGEVVSCRWIGSAYQACIVFSDSNPSDRRCAERFPVTEDVLICADSLESQREAVVVDLSARGMGLEISAPLEIGEIVTIESACDEAFGVVRHCRELRTGRFHVGVEIFHIMPKDSAAEGSRKHSVVSRVFSFH